MAPTEQKPPSNTPTDPQDAKPTEVRAGRNMPGMMTVLIVSIIAIAAIFVVVVALNVGANEDELATDPSPSELLDEAPPDISGEPAN